MHENLGDSDMFGAAFFVVASLFTGVNEKRAGFDSNMIPRDCLALIHTMNTKLGSRQMTWSGLSNIQSRFHRLEDITRFSLPSPWKPNTSKWEKEF